MDLALELDDDVYERLERRAENNGFDSTEDYCRTILRTVIEELDEKRAADDVEKRLEDLGYLN